jgi:hypothetical protein
VYTPVVALITPPPEKTEYVYGVNPPVAENVNKLLIANVLVRGVMITALIIVTVALAVLLKLSVTRTVTEPADAGAVKAPVPETILPPPVTIEYV